jgi:phosphoenolpyruvate carboxykinase (ATP)
MISAALTGKLDDIAFSTLPVFNLSMPTQCEGVPSEILNPRDTWADKALYDQTARNLAGKFIANFEKFSAETDAAILAAAPAV